MYNHPMVRWNLQQLRINKQDLCQAGWSKHIQLVGGIPTPLKNMSSSVGDDILNWMQKKKQLFQTTIQLLIFHYQRVNHHKIIINIPIKSPYII